MPATVAQLGARALRKLGVTLIGSAERPSAPAPVNIAAIIDLALRAVGITVPESQRPAASGPTTDLDIAERVMRAVGLNPAGVFPGSTARTYTFQQIGVMALRKLAIIGSDEPGSPEDQGQAGERVVDVHDQLNGLGFVTWTASTIPAGVAEAYVTAAANLLGPAYGRPATLDNFNAALGMVRQYALSGERGRDVARLKVASVHDHLSGLGLVSWTLAAIPQAVAEDYVSMTAALMAPVVGQTVEPAARQAIWEAGERGLRRIGMIAGVQARMADMVRGILAELASAGLVDFDDDHIPLALADAVAAILGAQIGPSFGKPEDPKAIAAAETRLWRAALGGPAGQRIAEAQVRSVQEYLEGRGMARWSLWDIPRYAEEPMVFMAAVWLAPEARAKADPNWWPAAERMLFQMIELPTDHSPVIGSYF